MIFCKEFLQMTTLSTRLSQKELDYLETIALENKLYKGATKKTSLGKAMKELIKWCQLNDIDISKPLPSMDGDTKKMIEHIHLSIPNLLYLSRIQTLLGSDKFSDEEVTKCRKQTIAYLNTVCGDFQNVTYSEIPCSSNEIGLNQSTIEPEKTKWKLP